jgi:hypothetical protein
MDTLDAIEAELAELQRHKARIAAREADLIQRADQLQAPYLDGARTMGEWLARRCDMDRARADRLVRTATAIPDEVHERLAAGDISVDRAHAYTEAALRHVDPRSLEGLEIASIWGLIRRRQVPQPVDRYLVVQPSLDLGHYKVHGRLGATQGSVVTQALVAEMDRMTAAIPGPQRPKTPELRADALTSICEGGQRRAVVSIHRTHEGVVEIDGIPASHGEADHAECVGSTEHVAGETTGPNRTTVPPAQRRRILYRDQQRCTIEGCLSRHRLETHHVVPRADGGPNTDDNLATLCWFHHHVAIHRRGMTLDPTSPPGRRRLTHPDP